MNGASPLTLHPDFPLIDPRNHETAHISLTEAQSHDCELEPPPPQKSLRWPVVRLCLCPFHDQLSWFLKTLFYFCRACSLLLGVGQCQTWIQEMHPLV